MKPQDLIAAFETLADAPDGVTRLRELVLQLAVRGKLVPQDPKDEPASVLLERIAAETTRLVKEGKSRKSTPLPPIVTSDVPYEVPSGWEWARFATIARIASNLVKPDAYPAWPHIAPNHIDKGTGRLLPFGTVAEDAVTSSKHRFFAGQILYSKIRPNLSKAVLVDFDGLCSADMYPLDALIAARYLHLFILSPPFIDVVTQDDNRLAMPKVNQEQLSLLAVPVPPLAEQHRIVARVDELMGLLDRLEAARDARDATRVALRDAALAELRDADDAETVQVAWARIAEHMDDLFTHPDDVAPLRQTILQLAVRGRLVPQDPDDEPASAFLGARATSPETPPYELPAGWSWTDIASLGELRGGGTPSKGNPEYWGPGVPWVTPKDMKRPRIDSAIDDITEAAIAGSSAKLIPSGSLLMVVRGMILAHTFPTALTVRDVAVNQDMKALLPFDARICDWLLLATGALQRDALALVERSSHGTCKLPTASITTMPIPLPPLAEQDRIVAWVDELMGRCDELAARLAATVTARCEFAAAAVHHLDV